MARLADPQTASIPAEPGTGLPPLSRSEAFPEDLPGWPDAAASEPGHAPAPRWRALLFSPAA